MNSDKLLIDALKKVNTKSGGLGVINELQEYFRNKLEIDAVAIRLRDGEDYPYFLSDGFPQYFIEAENNLCHRCENNEIIRDCDDLPVLDCMCGNIIRGRFDSELPFFTAKGSFWSNGTTKLLQTRAEEETVNPQQETPAIFQDMNLSR